MAEFSKEFLERTIEIWQSRYSYPLTLDDAREIAESMTNLFKLLDALNRSSGMDSGAGVFSDISRVAYVNVSKVPNVLLGVIR